MEVDCMNVRPVMRWGLMLPTQLSESNVRRKMSPYCVLEGAKWALCCVLEGCLSMALHLIIATLHMYYLKYASCFIRQFNHTPCAINHIMCSYCSPIHIYRFDHSKYALWVHSASRAYSRDQTNLIHFLKSSLHKCLGFKWVLLQGNDVYQIFRALLVHCSSKACSLQLCNIKVSLICPCSEQ